MKANARLGFVRICTLTAIPSLELGTHAPLAAACSALAEPREEGEYSIARRTLGALATLGPGLLLADALYGRASFMLDVSEQSGGACQSLIRVGSRIKGKQLEVLADGSALVAAHSERRARAGEPSRIVVREIRALVTPAQGKPYVMRRWTTLLDPEKYPAAELLALYTQRWEQELFFRELKRHIGANSLLQADSENSAQGVFAAMLLAAYEVAQARVSAAQSVELPVLRLSIAKISRYLEQFAAVMQAGRGIISAQQAAKMERRWLKLMAKGSHHRRAQAAHLPARTAPAAIKLAGCPQARQP